jgi:hypothetical protein
MAYQGYLIKVGDYTIRTDKYIKASSYIVTANGQDLNSTRDEDGYLHRTALEHVPIKVEFETPPMLTNKEFADLMSNIRKRYTNATEKKCSITAYVPEYDDYITQDVYVPDISPTIYGNYGGVIHYESIRIAFIGY